MLQRTKVVGARTPVIWLLIVISLIVIAALAVGGLVIYPQMQKQQAEQTRAAEAEQHYQAGVAFQNVSDWTAAEGEYKQVIVLDATYKDAQSRLAEVRTKLAGDAATATAVAQATAAAGPTATAAALEAHYQKGLGYMNMSQWTEAKTELELVFAAAPNYQEVQAKLTEVRKNLSELALLAPTLTPMPPASPTPRPVPVASPIPSNYFAEDFEGNKLDATKWETIGGVVTIGSGRVHLESASRTFPYIYAKENPFPLQGDFSFSVRLRYPSVTGWGVGLTVGTVLPPSGAGAYPSGILQIWQDRADGWEVSYDQREEPCSQFAGIAVP